MLAISVKKWKKEKSENQRVVITHKGEKLMFWVKRAQNDSTAMTIVFEGPKEFRVDREMFENEDH